MAMVELLMRMNENENESESRSESESESRSKVDSQILRDLVEGWRATAQEYRLEYDKHADELDRVTAEALEKCASELAAKISLS